MEKTWGIVLGSVHLPGGKTVVRIFTEARGTVPFIVHGTHNKTAAVRPLLLMPLHVVEIDYEHHEGRELQTLKELQLRWQYTTIPYDPLKQTMALFLAEFLTHALRREGKNTALLQYVTEALRYLDEAQRDFTSMHVEMLRGVADFLGYGTPQLQEMSLPELVAYYRETIPEFPALSSLTVLHDVLR